MFVIFVLILCALTLVEIVTMIVVKVILLVLIFLISAIVIYNTRPVPPKPAPAPAHGHGGHGGGHGHTYTAIGINDPKGPPIARWLFIGLACVCLYFLAGWALSWRSAMIYAERGAEHGYTMHPIVYFKDEHFGTEWTWRVLGFNRRTCHQELRILKCSPVGHCQLWEHPIDLGVDPNGGPCTPTEAPAPRY